MGIFSHSEINTISILGCGWLGMALAEQLVKDGFKVKGSTTHPDKIAKLKQIGATGYLIKLLPEPEGDRLHEFLESDLLIIAIPPGTRSGMPDTYHPTQIKYLVEHIEKSITNRVIYISSTSVYPNGGREVTEDQPLNPMDAMNRSIVLAEEVVMNNKVFQSTILRCGGLMGYDRIPGKYFAGKKDLKTAKVQVNYIHRDDVIGIVKEVFQQGAWDRIFNAVAPKHPTRKDIYLKNAANFGFEAPSFDETAEAPFKVVSSYKVLTELQYQFKYPDPLEFAYTKILKDPYSDDPHETPDLY